MRSNKWSYERAPGAARAAVGAAASSAAEGLRAAGDGSDDVRQRLSQIGLLYGDDLKAVAYDLAHAIRQGTCPGTDAAMHLVDAGGKRVRPITAILAAACFGPINPAVRAVAVVAELVHLATLLHDDVVDGGTERRGKPCSRLLWGNAMSVLSGDMLLVKALEQTAASAPKSVLEELLVALRRLVDGEIVQLAAREALDLDEPTYFRIIENKTASLFEWTARAGATCAGASEAGRDALGEYGSRIGMAFQLVDDVIDYSEDARAGKAVLADLTEGKLTLPLICTLSSQPSLRGDVDASRGGDADAACRVASAVRRSGACDTVRAMARRESVRALEPLERLPASPARKLLGTIARELALRAS